MSAKSSSSARGHRRPPRAPQCGCAGGDAGARRRQQFRHHCDRRHCRRDAGARSLARDLADHDLCARPLDRDAADRMAGAALRTAHGISDRHDLRRGHRTALLPGRAEGFVSDFLCRRVLFRPLCRRASGLPLRRRRYRERRVQAQSDFLGAAWRRVRGRCRPAVDHPDQRHVAAVSVRSELYRAIADRGAGGRRVCRSSKFRCRRPCRKVRRGVRSAKFSASRVLSSRSRAGSQATR